MSSLTIADINGKLKVFSDTHRRDLVLTFIFNFDSPDTRRNYLSDIMFFYKFIRDFASTKRIELSERDINETHIILYKNLELRGYAQNTIYRRLASVKSYFDYLFKKRVIDSNPFDRVRMPKKPTEFTTGELEGPEVLQIVNPDLYENTEIGRRDLCLMNHFFYSALRIKEIVSLKFKNIVKINGVLCFSFTGKGAKDRISPINVRLIDALGTYLETRSDLDNPEAYLYPGISGHLSEGQARALFKKRVQISGVKKHPSPHWARATLISEMIERGENIDQVATDFGHSNINTTWKYKKKRARISLSPLKDFDYV